MHVLLLTPSVPWPPDTGGKLRIYYLLMGLMGQHHQVDLGSVYVDGPPDVGPLAEHGAKVLLTPLGQRDTRRQQWHDLLHPWPRSVLYFYSTQARQAMLTQFTAPYDLIISDEVMMIPYARAVAQQGGAPILLIRPKIDWLHYAAMAQHRPWGKQKFLDWWEAQQLQRYERRALRACAAAVVCSEEDSAITRQQNEQVMVATIANGADTTYFTPQRVLAPQPTILLLGTMHYYPNVDAVHYFFEAIYPALQQAHPDLQILIVGHQPPAAIQQLAQRSGVTVTGSVTDVRPYLNRSWLLAVPLRLGGGTRLKIAEAMAAGLPVVSTTIGAQGLAVEDERQLLLADTPAAFVAATTRLLGDPALRQRLAVAGRHLVEAAYSWQVLGAQFAEFCTTIARQHQLKRNCQTESSYSDN